MSLVSTPNNDTFVITSNNPALDVINIYRKSRGQPELDIMEITDNTLIKWIDITNYELGTCNNWNDTQESRNIAKELYEEIEINPDLSAAIRKTTKFGVNSLPFDLSVPEVEAMPMPEETLFPELYKEQEHIDLNEQPVDLPQEEEIPEENKEVKQVEYVSQFNADYSDDETREFIAMDPYQPREFLTASEMMLLDEAEEMELIAAIEEEDKKFMNKMYKKEKKDLKERKKPMSKKFLDKIRVRENVEEVRVTKNIVQQKIDDAKEIIEGITENDIQEALNGGNDKIMDAIEIVLKSNDWKLSNIIQKTNYICRRLLKFKEPISTEDSKNCTTGLYWNLINDECLNTGFYNISLKDMSNYKELRRTLKYLWSQQYNWVLEEKGGSYSAATLRENKKTKGNWNNDILVIRNNVTKELKCYTVKTNKTAQRNKQLLIGLITPNMVLRASDIEKIEPFKKTLDYNMNKTKKLTGDIFTTLKSFILNGGVLIFHENDPYRVLWEDLNKLVISILLKMPLVNNSTLRPEYPQKIRINIYALRQILSISSDTWQHFVPCVRWNQ